MGRPFFMPMNTRSSTHQCWFAVLLILFFTAGCSPAATPTPFRPPTVEAPLVEPTFIIHPTQQERIVIQSTPLPTIIPTVDPKDCSNDLKFIQDLTIPDDSVITLGLVFDKQWLVENSGTCHWNSGYHFKHVGGGTLGAPEEIALYPARAGTQATIQIQFTAPFTEGVYESAWQAVDADGNAFGDPVYLRIIVQ
ncbi:MAG TPA: NBR1-Ig-like domain-containing protein [Anaerolineales bacterium]|nr:NBR1-Ig-like domain-containing protein [Anaerolineales bacterium]